MYRTRLCAGNRESDGSKLVPTVCCSVYRTLSYRLHVFWCSLLYHFFHPPNYVIGYKLGTLCIIDSRPRPMGLTLDEQDTLHDLADMTMKVMVDRRYQLQTRENPAQLIAYTAHDLMTPLTGVQLSLSLLKEDEEVQRNLGSHHLELLKTAANCSDLMIRICQTVIDTLRQETPASLPTDLMGGSTGNMPVTKMAELLNSLSTIMEPIPKPVPLIITLDPKVPAMIMSDDLKLFRSALNLLSHALSRTEL
jgi:signal transduction histidine kinase